jgi:hypothetical protein
MTHDQEHSPLPWHDDGFGTADRDNKNVDFYGNDGKPLANRRLIITALKSHAAHAKLLAAAKAAMIADDDGEYDPDAWQQLKAAVAAAEESAPL